MSLKKSLDYSADGANLSAQGFFATANTLHDKLKSMSANGELKPLADGTINPVVLGLACSMCVLMALSIEVAIKALAKKQTRIGLTGHDHVQLFLGIPEDLQKRVGERYANHVREKNIQQKAQLPENIHTVIEETNRVFVEWRYIYESNAEKPCPFGAAQLAARALLDEYDAE